MTWIIMWMLGPSSFCSIHSARKVKTSSYNCITFLLCNPPNPSFLFFLSFFSSEASETKSQTGDWQSD